MEYFQIRVESDKTSIKRKIFRITGTAQNQYFADCASEVNRNTRDNWFDTAGDEWGRHDGT